MIELAATATEAELRFIAGLDHGLDAEQHLVALRRLIFERDCAFEAGEHWFPYEVVELGAHWLQAGHEREFAICTLLVIHAVRTGFDKSSDLAEKFEQRASDYSMLPAALSAAILAAYADSQGATGPGN